MSKHNSVPNAQFNSEAAGEDEIRELLQQAGPRPEVPPEELKVIKSAARTEWQRLVDTEQHRRRRTQFRGVLALAASLLLVLLVGWWWRADKGPARGDVVATVELIPCGSWQAEQGVF